MIAFVGGDARQIAASLYLRSVGCDTDNFALGEEAEFKSLREAKAVVLPLPCEKSALLLNAPLCRKKVYFSEILPYIRSSVPVLAGRPSGTLTAALRAQGVKLRDYSMSESFTLKNAALTAENAVGRLICELPRSLSGARVLVTGFGRIGRVLAEKLSLLGAGVTCSARKAEAFGRIASLGYGLANSEALGDIGRFDAVINTVPAEIFTPETLRSAKAGAVYMELASPPYGADTGFARECGMKVFVEGGLPGRLSPESAGIAVGEEVLNILREEGIIDG